MNSEPIRWAGSVAGTRERAIRMLAPSGSSWSSGTSALAQSTPAAVAAAVVPHPVQTSSGTPAANGSAAGTPAAATDVPPPRTRTVSVLTVATRRRAVTAAPGGQGAPRAGAQERHATPPRGGDKARERDHPGTT